MTNPNQPTWLPGTVGPISAGTGGPQGGGSTIPTNPQTCPPGYRGLGNGMCEYCPPAGYGIACQPISLMDAWRQYDATQRSLSIANGGTSAPPPAPPGSLPPSVLPIAPPPPYPPGGSPPQQSGGSPAGTVYQTTGGTTAITGGGTPYPSPRAGPNGSAQCIGPFGPSPSPPQIAQRFGWRMLRDSQGQWWYCPPGASPPNPNPPPPPPSPPASGPSQCPQTYTIVQGPPCPQFLAVLGTPDSWRASGFQLSAGWTILQSLTDTPANIQAQIAALAQRCAASTALPQPLPPG